MTSLTCAPFETSSAYESVFTPNLLARSAATFFTPSAFTSISAMAPPSSAIRSAVARPSPDAAPVITTFFPSNRFISVSIQFGPAAPMVRGVAKREGRSLRALQVEPDVELVGHAHAAVHLDGLLGDVEGGLDRLRLGE